MPMVTKFAMLSLFSNDEELSPPIEGGLLSRTSLKKTKSIINVNGGSSCSGGRVRRMSSDSSLSSLDSSASSSSSTDCKSCPNYVNCGGDPNYNMQNNNKIQLQNNINRTLATSVVAATTASSVLLSSQSPISRDELMKQLEW